MPKWPGPGAHPVLKTFDIKIHVVPCKSVTWSKNIDILTNNNVQ